MDSYGGEEKAFYEHPMFIGFVVLCIIIGILFALGVFTSDPLSNYNAKANWDFPGNDISCGQYKNIEYAVDACNNEPSCKGFSSTSDINTPWCLKRALPGSGETSSQAMFYTKK